MRQAVRILRPWVPLADGRIGSSLRGVPRWRSVLAALAVALGGCSTAGGLCTRQSECQRGTYCSNRGHCVRECTVNQDCPCGSRCATQCGLCLTTGDAPFPATCFAIGSTVREILGACRVDGDAQGDSAEDAPQDVPSDASNDVGSVPATSVVQCDPLPVTQCMVGFIGDPAGLDSGTVTNGPLVDATTGGQEAR